MPNRFGPRGVLALMIPLQNANMQPEYDAMRPVGISNQIYRFSLAAPDNVPEAVIGALPDARGCFPDLILCGNSLEMRHWSVDRQSLYRKEVQDAVPEVPVCTATDATVAALRTVGASKIAVLSPMSEVYSKSVAGITAPGVLMSSAITGLTCPCRKRSSTCPSTGSTPPLTRWTAQRSIAFCMSAGRSALLI